MDKLLSIIVPCYNMEQYLPKCLDSLRLDKQKHYNLLNVLVINDGSKDNTSKIAHQYANQFPEAVKIIDKENGHYGSCINAGLAIANGKYVKILEPDDIFDINGFDQFLSELSTMDREGKLDSVDLILTDYAKIDINGNKTTSSQLKYKAKELIDFNAFQEPLTFHILLPAVTYRLSILKEMNYHQTEGCPYTDIEWLSIPMHAVRNIIYFPYFVYMYLIGREGQSVQVDIYSKNVYILVKLIKGLLINYNLIIGKNRSDVKKYIDKVILSQLKIIYHKYLIEKNSSNKELEELYNLDELLNITDLELYKKSNFVIKSKFFSYNYVSLFREKSNFSVLYKIMFILYARLSKLYSKLFYHSIYC